MLMRPPEPAQQRGRKRRVSTDWTSTRHTRGPDMNHDKPVLSVEIHRGYWNRGPFDIDRTAMTLYAAGDPPLLLTHVPLLQVPHGATRQRAPREEREGRGSCRCASAAFADGSCGARTGALARVWKEPTLTQTPRVAWGIASANATTDTERTATTRRGINRSEVTHHPRTGGEKHDDTSTDRGCARGRTDRRHGRRARRRS